MKAMADHSTDTTNMVGFIFTLAGVIFSYITASDLAAVLTGVLAIINIIVVWPKLKTRLRDIFKKKNK